MGSADDNVRIACRRMRMTLFVDDKKTEDPDSAAIAREFESIDKKTALRSRGLSLVILQRGEDDSLTAGGHPVEGWGGLIHEHNGINRGARLSGSVTQEKIVQIFQAYTRGDDLWEQEFEWEIVAGKFPVSRIVISLAILLVLVLFLRSCVK